MSDFPMPPGWTPPQNGRGWIAPDGTEYLFGPPELTYRDVNAPPDLRKSTAYRRWRRAVLARDGRACRRCGATADLTVHHIRRWRDFPELRFDVDNGLTLCRDCHGAEQPRARHE